MIEFILVSEHYLVKSKSSPLSRTICIHVRSQANAWCNRNYFGRFSTNYVNKSHSRVTVYSKCLQERARQCHCCLWLFRISRCILLLFDPKVIIYPSLCQVLPHPPETDLLFADGTGNRESTGWIEKTDGIPNIECGNRWGEGKRVQLCGSGIDKSKESLHTSRGAWFHRKNTVEVDPCWIWSISSV
jgi:hypothetical protein